jgi:hypothetical protein
LIPILTWLPFTASTVTVTSVPTIGLAHPPCKNQHLVAPPMAFIINM